MRFSDYSFSFDEGTLTHWQNGGPRFSRDKIGFGTIYDNPRYHALLEEVQNRIAGSERHTSHVPSFIVAMLDRGTTNERKYLGLQ